MYRNFVKPVIEYFTALIALIVVTPLLIPVCLLLSITSRGRPFFIQKRPGKDARIFNVIKFRTMNDLRGPDGKLLPDSERLTGIGSVIRKTSLDEIPQLINVLKREMNLIGPRPLLPDYLPLYNYRQSRRHEVRPGITGWAQVNGRNDIRWEDRLEMDVWYVDHISFGLDMKILFLSLVRVFKGEGISSANAATMERFRGNKKPEVDRTAEKFIRIDNHHKP